MVSALREIDPVLENRQIPPAIRRMYAGLEPSEKVRIRSSLNNFYLYKNSGDVRWALFSLWAVEDVQFNSQLSKTRVCSDRTLSMVREIFRELKPDMEKEMARLKVPPPARVAYARLTEEEQRAVAMPMLDAYGSGGTPWIIANNLELMRQNGSASTRGQVLHRLVFQDVAMLRRDFFWGKLPPDIGASFYAMPLPDQIGALQGAMEILTVQDQKVARKVGFVVNAVANQPEMDPATRAFWKAVSKAMEPQVQQEMDTLRQMARDDLKTFRGDKKFLPSVYKNLELLNWFRICQTHLDMPIVGTVFKLEVEGTIGDKDKILAAMAVNHALDTLLKSLREMGVPEAQVDAFRERLGRRKLTVVFVSDEEWKNRHYGEAAAGTYGSDGRIHLRFNNTSGPFGSTAPSHDTVVHEMLHHLSGGYSNNSGSRSLHEALTETFTQIALFKELGLPIQTVLGERPAEQRPSGRYSAYNLVLTTTPSYQSMVTNDEFLELFAVVGRPIWQEAYFSGDYSAVRQSVNNYLDRVPDAFAYLFDDRHIEGSIAAALADIGPEGDPLRWTEKFDRARRPYTSTPK